VQRAAVSPFASGGRASSSWRSVSHLPLLPRRRPRRPRRSIELALLRRRRRVRPRRRSSPRTDPRARSLAGGAPLRLLSPPVRRPSRGAREVNQLELSSWTRSRRVRGSRSSPRSAQSTSASALPSLSPSPTSPASSSSFLSRARHVAPVLADGTARTRRRGACTSTWVSSTADCG